MNRLENAADWLVTLCKMERAECSCKGHKNPAWAQVIKFTHGGDADNKRLASAIEALVQEVERMPK